MAKANKKQTRVTNNNVDDEKNFTWIEEEIALLLRVVLEYKTSKAAAGIDWETVKSKYEDIKIAFQNNHPTKEATVNSEEFPHCEDPKTIGKGRIVPKLKRIKAGFRKAIDSKRNSGGGRVVMALYDECMEIWGGSPAVESFVGGLESSVTLLESDNSPNSSKTIESSLDDDSLLCMPEKKQVAEQSDKKVTDDNNFPLYQDAAAKTAKKRSEMVQFLKERKDEKLTKRLSTDPQLVDIAKDDVAIKKKAYERLDTVTEKYDMHMKAIADNMTALTSAVTNGF